MRGAITILTMILLAACADDGQAPLAGDQIHVRFPAGGVVDVIEVDVVNRLPLRKAELIATDGQATPATYLNVPSSAVTGGAPQQRAALLAMASTASIPLPDPVEYRRDWRSYRVRLSFGDGPSEVETREVDAPEPPPGG